MQKFKGSALISALFIMTLVAIAATAMSTRLQLDIYRTKINLESDKLYLAAEAVQFWGLNELSNPNQNFFHADAEGKVLNFPTKFQGIYPRVQIKGALYDLQSRFNVNNLVDIKFILPFQILLKETVKKMEPKQTNELSKILHNWLIPYQPGQDETLNLNYYLSQKPGYFPGQQLMQSSSEFRLLKNVDAKTYQSLQNHIVALPEPTPININTASKTVLTALGFGLSGQQVDELIQARGKEGISDMAKLNPLLLKNNIRPDQITIESQYFLAVANLSSENLTLTSYTILKRKKDKTGKVTVSLISESVNVFN